MAPPPLLGRYWWNSPPDEWRTGWWWKGRNCATSQQPVVATATLMRAHHKVPYRNWKNTPRGVMVKTMVDSTARICTGLMEASDDLTKARAALAYQARQARPQGSITETWIYESKIIIKDNRSRIHQVTSLADLQEQVKNSTWRHMKIIWIINILFPKTLAISPIPELYISILQYLILFYYTIWSLNTMG